MYLIPSVLLLLGFLLLGIHVRFFLRHYQRKVTDVAEKRNRYMNYLGLLTSFLMIGLAISYFFVINSQL